MMVQAIPIFQNGQLLRREMLEALSDNSFLANKLLYKGYGDGILAGCQLTATGDAIILNTGIIFVEGGMFLIKEPMCVNYHPTDTTTVMKIRFSDELQNGSFIYREVDVFLTEQTMLQKGEVELCRFKLQKGARLRYEYQSFEDRNTEFDTLNTIYAAYSAKGGSTLAPDILRNFASELLEVPDLSDFDALFCIQLLNQSQPLNKDALLAYLQRRNRQDMDRRTNLAVYQELARILREEKSGVKGGKKGTVKKKWSMMLE